MCFLNMITDNRLIEIPFKMFYFGSDAVGSLVILPDCVHHFFCIISFFFKIIIYHCKNSDLIYIFLCLILNFSVKYSDLFLPFIIFINLKNIFNTDVMRNFS